MRILSFQIHDADGWTLEPMKLDAFNLLVGVSGAGKTRIVRAIEQVCAVALGTAGAEDARGARFVIAFEHDALLYRWEAELEPEDEGPLVRWERITRGGQPLVDRTAERFIFGEREIPRLDRAKSAIAILKEDPAMAPLHVAFSRCFFMVLDAQEDAPGYTFTLANLEKQRHEYASVGDLGANLSLPIQHKVALLASLFPDAFAEIEADFRDAFSSIEELRVLQLAPPPEPDEWRKIDEYVAVLSVRESGVAKPFAFSDMSSGMQRYLSFLIHLSFAPRGTVVLIDELEASFGLNCLPAATDFLLRRAPDLQLILTSHHPYIIQKIPIAGWKLVTRQGSQVRVLDAATIPALDEARSRLDHFTRLINLPEYVHGIQA